LKDPLALDPRSPLPRSGLWLRAFPASLAGRPGLDKHAPWQRAHSWTYNGLLIRGGRLGNTTNGVEDVTTTTRSVAPTANAENCAAPAFNDDYGIIMGVGTTTNPATANNMASRVPQGNTLGTLTYGAMTIGLPDALSVPQRLLLQRTMTNLWFDDLLALEQGLFGQTGTWRFLLAIDHLGVPVLFPPGAPTMVQYLITAQF